MKLLIRGYFMEPKEIKEILVKRNIEKSDDSLKIAELIIKENIIFKALNMIYYACFYTVTALAEKHDFKTSKHSGLLKWFNKKFVYEDKVFSEEMYKVYQETFDYRQKDDYNALYIPTLEETLEILEKAKVFIKTVREYLDSID